MDQNQITTPEAPSVEAPVESAAAPVPPVETTTAEPLSTPQSSKSPLGAGIAIIVGLALVAGGAVYAYTQGLIPGIGGAPFGPEKALSEMVNAFDELESGRASVDFNFKTEARDDDVYPLPEELLEGSGMSEFGMELLSMMLADVPSDFSFDLGLATTFDLSDDAGAGGEASTDIAVDLGDFVVNAEIDFVYDNAGSYYVKADRFPSIVFDLGAAKGQWVKLTDDDLEAFGIPVSDFDLAAMSEEEAEQLEDAMKFVADMFALIPKHDVVAVAEPVAEEVAGEKLYRYQMSVNGTNLEVYYREFFDLYKKYMMSSIPEDDEFTREFMEEFVDATFTEEMIQLYSSQAYVDYSNIHAPWSLWFTKGGELRQIGTEVRLVLEEDLAPQFTDKQMSLAITVRLEDVNQPIVITAPADAKTLEELAEDVPYIQEMLDGIEEGKRFEVQYSVDTINYDMDTYLLANETYPATLAELSSFSQINDEELYGFSYSAAYTEDDAIIYAGSVDGFIACSPYPDTSLHYCITESVAGDVDLNTLGDPTTGLIDMHPVINQGLLSGDLLTPEARDEARKQAVEDVDSEFSWTAYEYDTYAEAWTAFKESESVVGGVMSQLPAYVEIQYTATTDAYDDEDYEICARLETKEAYWCVDSYSYSGYEVEVTE